MRKGLLFARRRHTSPQGLDSSVASNFKHNDCCWNDMLVCMCGSIPIMAQEHYSKARLNDNVACERLGPGRQANIHTRSAIRVPSEDHLDLLFA